MDSLADEARELVRQLVSGECHDARPSVDVTELLDAVSPHLHALGITRVGDLTALDTIGIPVFFACRPNSRTLSVSQGKALDPGRARLGAIMEALEQAFAERHELLVRQVGSRLEMRGRGLKCIDTATTLRCSPVGEDVARCRSWVLGTSLLRGDDVYVPYELAGVDFRVGTGWDHSTYRMSTVGLGAGGSLASASLHALLEVIENDATAALDVFGLQGDLARPVCIRTGRHAGLDEALEKVNAAGLGCFFARVRSGTDIPTVAAFLNSPLDTHENLGIRTFAGFACRFSEYEAAFAALLEAVQSRLTQFAGSREDLAPDQYRQRLSLLHPKPGASAYLDETHCSIGSENSTLEKFRHALRAVTRQGAEDVVLVPLGAVGPDIRVVRVLVCGLQSAAGNGVVRLSASTLDAIMSRRGVPA